MAGLLYAGGKPVECEQKPILANCKKELSPYTYDSSEITKIKATDSSQVKEIRVPLFKGEKYRLTFDISDIPKKNEVVVNIFSTATLFGKRKLVFSSKDLPKKQDQFIFEPEKSKPLYVQYKIPGNEKKTPGGCVAFAVGYKLTFVNDQ